MLEAESQLSEDLERLAERLADVALEAGLYESGRSTVPTGASLSRGCRVLCGTDRRVWCVVRVSCGARV